MKKVLVVLVLVVMLFSVCACSYVPSTRFMSRSKVNSLVKEYGTPQAELTLTYKNNSNQDVVITIIYDLLLEQTPLAVIRFIQLAQEGFYDESVIDTNDTTYNFMVMGRYAYRNSIVNENTKNWYVNSSDVTFKGEFASNKYREPNGGYPEFKILSLAMYYDDHLNSGAAANFDSASGALIMAMANENRGDDKIGTLNHKNYAVFAHMVRMSYQAGTYKVDMPDGKVKSDAIENLVGFISMTSSRTIYTDATDTTTITSPSMVNKEVLLQVRILGNYDWSKLPQIGR